MGRPRARTDETTTIDRLLAAGLMEFGRRGFNGARLADIAGRAGITRPSLLYYFDSKEALYAAVMQDAFSRLGSALADAITAEGSFEHRFETVANTFAAFVEAQPDLCRLLVRELVDGGGPGVKLLRSEAVPVLDAVEAFMQADGSGVLNPDVDIRSGLMMLVSSALLQAGAGSMKEVLWGEADQTVELARLLFFESPGEARTGS